MAIGAAVSDESGKRTSEAELEAMAAALEASGGYKVLRRLRAHAGRAAPEGVPVRVGIFLDLETTGLDPVSDEIIEIALVPFTYGPDGTIWDVREAYTSLRQPGRAIPEEITRITGIDDRMVQGQVPDMHRIEELVAGANLIVAHNAAFDRRFAERFADVFQTKAWGCSMTEIDWAGEGFEGTKLKYLAVSHGLFFDGHRAVHDCQAAIEILSQTLPRAGITALAALLARARQPTFRIWAENSPFDLKHLLRARGYRWDGGESGAPRSWYVDVPEAAMEDELRYLREEIYQREVELRTKRVTAFERFSERW